MSCVIDMVEIIDLIVVCFIFIVVVIVNGAVIVLWYIEWNVYVFICLVVIFVVVVS